MPSPLPHISIVGYGRFGKVLYQLLKDDFAITLYRRSEIADHSEFTKNTTIAKNISDIYKNDVIFYAVPIESFEKIIAEHKKYFKNHHLLIDVLSVKLHPAQVFEKHLKNSTVQTILTHPMFGPDSSKSGFTDLPMVMHQHTASAQHYTFWKTYFTRKKLQVIEMTPEEHDRIAANSHSLTHFIGRVLAAYQLTPSPIDTLGTKKLLEITDQTCHDTWQLFTNLQHYNPYALQMRIQLGETVDKLYNQLLPEKDPHCLVYGIQGGKGSFNEEAIQFYLKKSGIKKYTIKYLHTSPAVMEALHRGEIDRGQFAVHNSAGGLVDESIQAMANYKFKIVDTFPIKIAHALMIRSDADFSEITSIMTHPQVLAQCKQTLAARYPDLQQTSGTGTLIDHALVAKNLSEGKLPRHIATMGSKILAELYNLKIVAENLQDLKVNDTIFLQVARL